MNYDNAAHLMRAQGGSFVRSLANAYFVADSSNKRKLIEAFAELRLAGEQQ